MTAYIRCRHSIESSSLSDYSRAVEQAQEYTTSNNESSIRRVVSFNTSRTGSNGGEYISTSHMTTLSGVMIANLGTVSMYCQLRTKTGLYTNPGPLGITFTDNGANPDTITDNDGTDLYAYGALSTCIVTIANTVSNNKTVVAQAVNAGGTEITLTNSQTLTTEAAVVGATLQFYHTSQIVIPTLSFIHLHGEFNPLSGIYLWTTPALATTAEVSVYGS